LKSPDVHMVPFSISTEELDFPLATVAIGAAAAENAVAGRAENLVWLLEDTLVLRSPSALVMPAWAQCAYRPVHHTNIGSVWRAHQTISGLPSTATARLSRIISSR
jgi:hypothetical protein